MRRLMPIAATIVAAMALAACNCGSNEKGENEAMCKEVNPGAVTSVNHYCVINSSDPVNPKLNKEYKGQQVGFCCKGCYKKWDAMSDAEKDAALAAAVAKGKP